MTKDEARLRKWFARTGLPPPECRGFVPAVEGDERPARIDPDYERERQRQERRQAELARDYVRPYPHHPTWALPSRGFSESPSWHDVVRAYEEDR